MTHASAHPSGEALGNRQPEAGSRDGGFLGAEPFVFHEQPVTLSLRYSDAGIGYLDPEVLRRYPLSRTSIVPRARVFDRIAQQVRQDLPKLQAVRHELERRTGRHREGRLQSPRPGTWLDQCNALLDQMPRVDPAQMWLRPSRLDPRIVEHNVDDIAHVPAGADDFRYLPRLGGVQGLVPVELVRVAEDAMQRRAQLMAQRREEAATSPGRPVRLPRATAVPAAAGR